MHDAPLHGSKMVVVNGHILFPTPSETAVVDDDGVGILDTYRATLDKLLVVAQSDASPQVPDDDIVRAAQVQLATPIEDALAWCRLSGDGDVVQFGTDVALQRDDTRHPEHDGSAFSASLRQCPPQRALTTVIEVRHLHHLAKAPTTGIFPKTLC